MADPGRMERRHCLWNINPIPSLSALGNHERENGKRENLIHGIPDPHFNNRRNIYDLHFKPELIVGYTGLAALGHIAFACCRSLYFKPACFKFRNIALDRASDRSDPCLYFRRYSRLSFFEA